MDGLVCADVLVGRMLERAAHVADCGIDDAGNFLEVQLGAPEASGGERSLRGFGIIPLLRYLLALEDKSHRRGVQTVAQAARRRAVIEYMTEVGVATGAKDFGSFLPRLLSTWVTTFSAATVGRNWPTRAGIEFRIRGEERQVTADAMIDASLWLS